MRNGTPRKKIEMLRDLPVFAGCSVRELAQIARLVDEVEMPKGGVLMQEGEPGRESFIIVDGTATVSVDGTEVATLGAGSFVGEMSLLELLPRTATVVAQTPVRLLAIGPQQFNSLLDNSVVARKLLATMAGRLRGVQEEYVAR